MDPTRELSAETMEKMKSPSEQSERCWWFSVRLEQQRGRSTGRKMSTHQDRRLTQDACVIEDVKQKKWKNKWVCVCDWRNQRAKYKPPLTPERKKRSAQAKRTQLWTVGDQSDIADESWTWMERGDQNRTSVSSRNRTRTFLLPFVDYNLFFSHVITWKLVWWWCRIQLGQQSTNDDLTDLFKLTVFFYFKLMIKLFHIFWSCSSFIQFSQSSPTVLFNFLLTDKVWKFSCYITFRTVGWISYCSLNF